MRFIRAISQSSLLISWLIALLALLVTLYASQVAKIPVCHLCWYQRVCIYPLTIILGIAAYRHDTKIIIYALPLALLGAIFALYQYLEQMIPGFAPIELCGVGVSCSLIHIKYLGFITIPFLSMMGSLAIAFFLIISAWTHRQ